MARLNPQMSPEVARIMAEAELKATDPGRMTLTALGTGMGELIPKSLGGLLSYYALGGQEQTESEAAKARAEGAFKRMEGESLLGAVENRRMETELTHQQKMRGLDLEQARVEIEKLVREGHLSQAQAMVDSFKGKGRPYSGSVGPQGAVTWGGKEGPKSLSIQSSQPQRPDSSLFKMQRDDALNTILAIDKQITQNQASVASGLMTATEAEAENARLGELRAQAMRNFDVAEGAYGGAHSLIPMPGQRLNPVGDRVPFRPAPVSGDKIDGMLMAQGINPSKYATPEAKIDAFVFAKAAELKARGASQALKNKLSVFNREFEVLKKRYGDRPLPREVFDALIAKLESLPE